MKTNEILDHLFYINYQLALGDVDQYFEKLGFKISTKEESILSYIAKDSSDLNGMSWYTMNIANGKISNSNFRTTKEVNLEAFLHDAEKHHGFKFEEETADSLIYKNGDLQMNVRIMKTNNLINTHIFYLFDPLPKTVQVSMMPLPQPQIVISNGSEANDKSI